jgi:hypothetical protein
VDLQERKVINTVIGDALGPVVWSPDGRLTPSNSVSSITTTNLIVAGGDTTSFADFGGVRGT